MNRNHRVMISGTGSSGGKTTITCGILRALMKKGKNIVPFKCGPDYIDPMFHKIASGNSSSNLDLFLCGERGVLNILGEKGLNKFSLIEGVMGFYDGLCGLDTNFSSYDLSIKTFTPVILVIDCKGKSLSLAAEINGFLDFKQNYIQGVILNNVSSSMEKMYSKIVRDYTEAEFYGFLPKIDEINFKSRHLGLITANEIENIDKKMEILGESALKYIDLDKIIALGEKAMPLAYDEIKMEKMEDFSIGVAMDEAFCFYYKENFELLEKSGAKIVYFSPIKDKHLPENIHGLIFGGGYPELYLRELGANKDMINDIKKAALSGMPIIGECGGFMYLLDDMEYSGEKYSLCGILQGESKMTDKLVRFGYINLRALEDTMLLLKGDSISAHEFHYSDSSDNGESFIAEKASGARSWKCIRSDGNIFAGYPHIHFYGNVKIVENFARACIKFKGSQL